MRAALRIWTPTTTPASSSKAGHLTKQQFVYTTLRESIIRSELPPGTRLVIDDLARQFKVSIIPVREALRLLQSEGLVLSVAHVGATVAPISRASVTEVFTLLEGLEVVAARVAAERATPADFETLSGYVAEMEVAGANLSPCIGYADDGFVQIFFAETYSAQVGAGGGAVGAFSQGDGVFLRIDFVTQN